MDEEQLTALQSKNPEKIKSILRKFNEKNAMLFDFSIFNNTNQWITIWKSIFAHLREPESATAHPVCLNTIRILTRDDYSLQKYGIADDIKCLLYLAGLTPDKSKEETSSIATQSSEETIVESLKCLCNLAFQNGACRQLLIETDACDNILKRVIGATGEHQSYEIDLFDLKLLFLMTALEPVTRNRVQVDLNGQVYLTHLLDQKLHDPSESGAFMDILCEILKVMFNITSEAEDFPDANEIQDRHMTSVIRSLMFRFGGGLANEKEQHVMSHAINLLTNVSGTCLSELMIKLERTGAGETSQVLEFEGWNLRVVDYLLRYTKLVMKQHKEKLQSAGEFIPPVLTVLTKSARYNRTMRHYIRAVILPPLKDVSQRPEVGNELRNHLCRYLTSVDHIVRDIAAELLFVCCKENVGRMIKYTGYGNAAGLFANRGLLDCRTNKNADYSSDSEDSDTEEYKKVQDEVNPVLGCYEAPKRSPFEGMSDEQKEFEAMQLVQLMDKLQRTGIVQPCRVNEDGAPEPVDHILQLQEELPQQQLDLKRKC